MHRKNILRKVSRSVKQATKLQPKVLAPLAASRPKYIHPWSSYLKAYELSRIWKLIKNSQILTEAPNPIYASVEQISSPPYGNLKQLSMEELW